MLSIVNANHRIITLLIVLPALLPGCAPAAAFAPIGLQSATGVKAPVTVRPLTATPLPAGTRPIYIVDPRNGEQTSQLLVVDPDARRLVIAIGTRYAPEIAISPDGTKLYVADSYSTRGIRGEHHDVVSVYDALTGALLHDWDHGELWEHARVHPRPGRALGRESRRRLGMNAPSPPLPSQTMRYRRIRGPIPFTRQLGIAVPTAGSSPMPPLAYKLVGTSLAGSGRLALD